MQRVRVKPQNVSLNTILARNRKPYVKKQRGVSNLVLFVVFSCVWGVLGAMLISAPVALAGSGVKGGVQLFNELPVDDTHMDVVPSTPIHVVDDEGKEFATFYSQNRDPLTSYDQIGDNLVNALVATEDSTFFEHHGVDLRGVARAAVKNLGGSNEGASTITMQLVENLKSLKSDSQTTKKTTVADKIKEIREAVNIEDHHSKEEILLAYFNTVSFGSGYYGVKTAAHGFFNKEPKDLTIPEAATLVGVLKGTELYSPVSNPENALNRRNTVLDRMSAVGFITDKERAEYQNTELGVQDSGVSSQVIDCGKSTHPYYCDMVRKEILNDPRFGETKAERARVFALGGFTVHTGLNETQTEKLDSASSAWVGDPWEATGANVEAGTGVVTAISQSTTWDKTQVNLATSRNQIGSTMKPIILAYALQKGFSMDTILNGSAGYKPTDLDYPTGGYSNTHAGGFMDAHRAIQISNNVFFVRLLSQYGVKGAAQFANSLGLSIPPLTGREGSLALGTYGASPVELAGAYATFASGGVYCQPHTITKVTRGDQEIFPADNYCHVAIPGSIAAQIQNVLSEPFNGDGTLAALQNKQGLLRGKSGSTEDWAVGSVAMFTPQYAHVSMVADPNGAQANPLSNGVNVYGHRFYRVAAGADTAGAFAQRGFMSIPATGQFSRASGPVTSPLGYPSVVGVRVEDAIKLGLTIQNPLVVSSTSFCPTPGIALSLSDSGLLVCSGDSGTYTEKNGVVTKQ